MRRHLVLGGEALCQVSSGKVSSGKMGVNAISVVILVVTYLKRYFFRCFCFLFFMGFINRRIFLVIFLGGVPRAMGGVVDAFIICFGFAISHDCGPRSCLGIELAT